ncbi:MAG: hypothetical protein ABIH69_06265 [bacterium]
MSLQEIEKRILAEAEAEAANIRAQNKNELDQLAKFQAEQKAKLIATIDDEAGDEALRIKRLVLVPARQKSKKLVLEAKQNIIGALYADIQKQKNLSNAETNKIREESEVSVAKTLFQ